MLLINTGSVYVIFSRLLLGVLLSVCLPVQAGNQQEIALADSVRLALARTVADGRPPKPQIEDAGERSEYLRWLGEMSQRLQRRIPDLQMRQEFLESVWYEATRAGLDPAMVLGLIQVESAFRKYAMSIVGARGYMQVMPFWTRVIGDSDHSKLFQMQANLRYGCAILRMYVDMEKGNLYLALGRYNGSRGRPDYPNAVLAAWNRWKLQS
ncbi:MAG: lytic transglycosylase domain-containing protein [Burkholderiaceae bacterium]